MGTTQIYNPYATTCDPHGLHPSGISRQSDSRGPVLTKEWSPTQSLSSPAAGPFFGTPNSSGCLPGQRHRHHPQLTQVQNEFDVRVDQTFGSKDSAWFRYSFINST